MRLRGMGALGVAAAGVLATSAPTPTPTLAPRGEDDSQMPAGGITITEPAVNAASSYYKIGPHVSVTFGWSFTSLTATPSRLFVAASCSQNGVTYPIAPSPSGIAGDATQITWYPYGYHLDALQQGRPDLIAAKYRLIVYDEKGPDGAAKGGEFQPNNQAEFALYFPQHYTPLSDWTCGSCSGAAGRRDTTVLLHLGALAVAVVLGAVWL
ncbi:hypothetical protein MNAN1_000528 [Malassezia nana]|uniref:DUF7137 domain-containing protein n=1 Tax=Malassezia nana TaxID=180528 RepID=A0AAF0J2F2_9BASI|nr:hypothetical protein MNAN1_000528 [Malassezia nana]